jgi:hypothetical protein
VAAIEKKQDDLLEVARESSRQRLEVEKERLAMEKERLALERERLKLESENKERLAEILEKLGSADPKIVVCPFKETDASTD